MVDDLLGRIEGKFDFVEEAEAKVFDNQHVAEVFRRYFSWLFEERKLSE